MTLNAHDNPSVGNKMITPRAAELQKCKKPSRKPKETLQKFAKVRTI
jgi:hypothetical protein